MIKLTDIVTDEETALALLEEDSWVGLDIETGPGPSNGAMEGLNPRRGRVAVISMYGAESKTPVVLHPRGKLSQRLKDWIGNSKRHFVVHNGVGFDIPFLYHAGVINWKQAEWYDTLIAECAVLMANRRDISVSLKATLARRAGAKITKDKGLQVSSWMDPILTEAQIMYCVNDIRFLTKLREEQLDTVKNDTRLNAIAVEQELLKVVVQMHINGMPIDLQKLEVEKIQWKHNLDADILEMRKLERDLISRGKLEFLSSKHSKLREQIAKGRKPQDTPVEWVNYGSPKQVMTLLNDLGCPVDGTDADILGAIALDPEGEFYPVIMRLLNIRGFAKRQSMFSEAWIHAHVEKGNRVYPHWWQCNADTGRFTCSDPNLQQVPRDARQVYGGVPDFVIAKLDYSQIEVRIAADIAEDEVMLQAFRNGNADIHRYVASHIFKTPEDQITKVQRQAGKAGVFSLLFGGGPQALVDQAMRMGLVLELDEATVIVQDFFKAFDGLRQERALARQMARMPQVLLTLPGGLIRQLRGATLTPQTLLNTAVQGTAAAGLKTALILCGQRGVAPYIVATVHDEIVLCVPKAEDELNRIIGIAKECMIEGMSTVLKKCPVEVSVDIGDYWK